MAICRFWQAGNCKFGSSCRNEHVGPSGGGRVPTQSSSSVFDRLGAADTTARDPFGQQNTTDPFAAGPNSRGSNGRGGGRGTSGGRRGSGSGSDREGRSYGAMQLYRDALRDRPLWGLSVFGLDADECMITGDSSMEEVRWVAYRGGAAGVPWYEMAAREKRAMVEHRKLFDRFLSSGKAMNAPVYASVDPETLTSGSAFGAPQQQGASPFARSAPTFGDSQGGSQNSFANESAAWSNPFGQVSSPALGTSATTATPFSGLTNPLDTTTAVAPTSTSKPPSYPFEPSGQSAFTTNTTSTAPATSLFSGGLAKPAPPAQPQGPAAVSLFNVVQAKATDIQSLSTASEPQLSNDEVESRKRDMEQFAAGAFTAGCIPERPPPPELCR